MRGIDHPYRNLAKGQWLRGNLHTHTTNTDGQNKPQTVINKYARLGHDFLAISDHDIYTAGKQYRTWDNKGMIMMPGNEISASNSNRNFKGRPFKGGLFGLFSEPLQWH